MPQHNAAKADARSARLPDAWFDSPSPHLPHRPHRTHPVQQRGSVTHLDAAWFHGDISREEAELRLRKAGFSSGLFLVRASSRGPSYYALSMVHDGNVGRRAWCSELQGPRAPRCTPVPVCSHPSLALFQVYHNTIEATPQGKFLYLGPERIFDSIASLIDHYMYKSQTQRLHLAGYVPRV